jgi:flagellar motor switch/type III secretory pathway protein FliN
MKLRRYFPNCRTLCETVQIQRTAPTGLATPLLVNERHAGEHSQQITMNSWIYVQITVHHYTQSVKISETLQLTQITSINCNQHDVSRNT